MIRDRSTSDSMFRRHEYPPLAMKWCCIRPFGWGLIRKVSAAKILHVCYNPKSLVTHEKLLLRKGYDVVTVLGTDGLISHAQTGDCTAVVLGEGASEDELAQAALWIEAQFRGTPVVSMQDLLADHPVD